TRYRLRGQVKSISRVSKDLSNLRRYRLVLLDESHNLRNREGKRFRAIQEYIRANESKVILLSATPYNKTTAKNEARTEQGCFVSFCSALSKTWRPTGTPRRSIRCPTAGQPTPTSDSGNLTCWIEIAPLAGAR